VNLNTSLETTLKKVLVGDEFILFVRLLFIARSVQPSCAACI